MSSGVRKRCVFLCSSLSHARFASK